MKRVFNILLVALSFVIVLPFGGVNAADVSPLKTAAVRVRSPERIVRPMLAVDPITLKAEGVTIRLWGIKPAMTLETSLELKALKTLDRLMNEQQINCKIVGGAFPELVGRCVTAHKEDLALALLSSGYVVVDRRQTYNSVFATGYAKAQETARLRSQGIWHFVNKAESRSVLPKWLQAHLEWLVPLALIIGPFGGLLIVAMVMRAGLSGITASQEREVEETQRKEAGLATRERQVLVAALESELVENKNKIDAFLMIYGDLSRSLKDGSAQPKYQQVGDIVQKHPVFSKAVFDANVGKLSLLNINAASALSKLYSALPIEQEYINLDPDVPLDTAVKLVDKVLSDTQAFISPIDKVVETLRAM